MTCESHTCTPPPLVPVSIGEYRTLDDIQLAHELALIARYGARMCRHLLREARLNIADTQTKGSHHDPVTVFDTAVEDTLNALFGLVIPGSLTLGEERGERFLTPTDAAHLPDIVRTTITATAHSFAVVGENSEEDVLDVRTIHPDVRSLGSRVRWIVDPIDGTSNFAAGMPYFNTSVAAELDGRVVAGAIHVPMTEETFWANARQGWFERGGVFSALDSTGPRDASEAVIATYFPSAKVLIDNPDHALTMMCEITSRFRAMRRPGASALDVAQLAAGRIGAFFATTVKPWDMAAAIHLARCSGAQIVANSFDNDAVRSSLPGGTALVAIAARGMATDALDMLVDIVHDATTM